MGLDKIRKEIDSVDDSLLELLNRRCELAIQVGASKKKSGRPFYVPEREKALAERLAEINKGPLPNRALKTIFREVVSASISLQHPLRVASLGSVARELFGASVEIKAISAVEGIFEAVENGDCDYGVVPFRDDEGKFIDETLEALLAGNLKIIAEREFGEAADIALGKQNTTATGHDHTTVAVTVKRPANLSKTVAMAMELHGIEPIAMSVMLSKSAADSKNLLMEIPGHPNDESTRKTLATISEMLAMAEITILGGYPVM